MSKNEILGWFKRKPDPSARMRELDAEIAALELEIRQLNNAAKISDPDEDLLRRARALGYNPKK